MFMKDVIFAITQTQNGKEFRVLSTGGEPMTFWLLVAQAIVLLRIQPPKKISEFWTCSVCSRLSVGQAKEWAKYERIKSKFSSFSWIVLVHPKCMGTLQACLRGRQAHAPAFFLSVPYKRLPRRLRTGYLYTNKVSIVYAINTLPWPFFWSKVDINTDCKHFSSLKKFVEDH